MNTSHVPKPKKLKNGLQYLILPTDSQTVSVSVMVKTGSAFESKKENGIAHFLEHMMFKGTQKRLTAKDVAIDFEKIGAINNAFTSHTTTGYWAKAQKDHAHTILEILSDIYNNAQFRTVEIEKEKGVVLQEMAMYEDMPQEKVSMMFDELMYPDQAFGRSILGSKETVNSLNEKQLRNFYNTHYGRERTWIVISGGVDAAAIEKDIKKYFGNAQDKVHVEQKLIEPKVKKAGEKYSFKEKKTDQVHFVLGMQADGYLSEDRYVYQILATILGRGMSSRLFIKMREELGICYYTNAGYGTLTETVGQFGVSAGVDVKRVDLGLKTVIEECMQFTKELVSDDELAKAKQMLKSSIAMNMETAEDIANFYATQYMRNVKIKTPDQIYKMLDKVTAEDVMRIAKKTFILKDMYLAAIGENISGLRIM
ncbi:MAG: pitrilysin family protein [Patescibacteria group bacterium]